MGLLLIGSGVLIVIIFLAVRSSLRGKKSRTGKKVLSEMLADTDEFGLLIRDLRAKCLQNEETVRRLINIEKDLQPDRNEIDWIRAAIIRWERDNR
jgi:hypothetical protein